MCFGGGGGGGGDAKAIQDRNEQLEAERQARIREGAGLIDTAFDQFDSGFYNDFKNSFLGFYEPQLEKQFGQARGDTVAALTDRGILGSTEGLRAMTDIQDKAALERTVLANRAADEANSLRSSVEREKSNLSALNETAADPARIGPLVQGAASSFTAPQAFSPLEDIFGTVLNNVAAFQAARNNAVAPERRPTFSTAPVTRDQGGSGRVVGAGGR